MSRDHKKVLTNGTTVFEDVGTLFPGRGGGRGEEGGRKGGGRGEEGGRKGGGRGEEGGRKGGGRGEEGGRKGGGRGGGRGEEGGRKGGGRGEEGGRKGGGRGEGGWMRKIFKASNLREIQAGKQFKTTRLYITTSNAYIYNNLFLYYILGAIFAETVPYNNYIAKGGN